MIFTVGGTPVSWARPRKRKGGTATGFYTPTKQKNYGAVLTAQALAARPAAWDLTGPFKVTVEAEWQATDTCRKRGHNGCHWTNRRADIDNAALKLVLDALTGICWDDDGQVVEAHAYKCCGKVPSLRVKVERVR